MAQGNTILPRPAKPKLGLRAWMARVLVECDRVATGFEADPVHDLRVVLRRCRSLADGLVALDPDPSWKEMKKAGKRLFRALGDLRDMQVMEEWISRLSDATDPIAVKLSEHLRSREAQCKQEVFQDLNQFDRRQWRQWSRTLPRLAARVRQGSVALKHLALEKWTAAYDLHKRAMRTRSQTALHELRIGIKRFRYTVENFLPQQHAAWGNDLKKLQDLLGEVHDLDVLWATALQVGAFPDVESRSRWGEMLDRERDKRIAEYREKMLGKESLWHVWRRELPSGPQLRAAAMTRLRVWASYLDPDFRHSQRVSKYAMQLYDGLRDPGLLTQNSEHDSRAILQAAALLHDVGKAKGSSDHQKDSFRMIRKLSRPLGWSTRELELAALIARYHRGALPRTSKKRVRTLDLPDRRLALQLAGVLRLANALDTHQAIEPRLEVAIHGRTVHVQSAGYSALDRSAEDIAAARHLLETVLRRPVIVGRLRITRGTRIAGKRAKT